MIPDLTPTHTTLQEAVAYRDGATVNALLDAAFSAAGYRVCACGAQIGPQETTCAPCVIQNRPAIYGAMAPALESLLDDLTAWTLEQFPDASNASVCAHLREEVAELAAAPGSGEECADIIMLAASWSKRCGNDLYADLAAKFATNRTRSWAHRDAGDYRKHVEPAPESRPIRPDDELERLTAALSTENGTLAAQVVTLQADRDAWRARAIYGTAPGEPGPVARIVYAGRMEPLPYPPEDEDVSAPAPCSACESRHAENAALAAQVITLQADRDAWRARALDAEAARVRDRKGAAG